MMKIICKARGKGKTTDAVKIAIEKNIYLVVRSRDEAMRLSREFKDLRFPITYDAILKGHARGLTRTKGFRSVVIDDADAFINHVCLANGIDKVEAITIPYCNKEE